ncbi:molybdopterin-guanine dinucleotide biosynthesis protein A [Novimethylophilus kurashikiensis]|uniref:Molybdenum cofactor guanylyltransferase n=1 Tax=Novimethylophilus kurashikiensis TaxID=1825523 RepID=A0A2R5FAT5_9PROT|nr:molybdenum cofactor guanylyltransferase MobA [Novimethylophilus kurashikiensis]GBG15317.1 molybdopterin-guanine dinucleotide biosynthesis protein A [Novimethylophilus kurashikiensis]
MNVSGILLAGGLGRRMGGTDKGLIALKGQPLAAHVAARFAPQVDELFINANQNIEMYAKLGYPVIQDATSRFAGPLAGLQAGLIHARHPLIATAPCDSPFLPSDLVARLSAALKKDNAQLAAAKTEGQLHPVFCLCRQDLLPSLTAFLDAGGRKMSDWLATLKLVEVNFDDEAEAFMNINTPQELDAVK